MKFYSWLTNSNGFCGRNAGKITLGCFVFIFVIIGVCYKLAPIQVNAINDLESNKENINEVRMSSLEYVYEFDNDVDYDTRKKIMDYLYSTVDSVRLLHMVNMRQHVIFGNYEEISVENDTTIYCPINAKIVDLQNTIESLP